MAKSKSAKKRAKQRAASDSQNVAQNASSSAALFSQPQVPHIALPSSLVAPLPSSPTLELLSTPTLAALDDKEAEHTSLSSISPSLPAARPLNSHILPQSTRASASPAVAQASSLDDMALELFAAKEAQSEVEQLRSQVARLQKEIEFKDAVIAKLQEGSGYSLTSRPAAVDTVVCAENVVHLSRHQQQREAALQCGVCVDYFSSPFTVECGHTFCYSCLLSWIQIHKSCPTCRTKLMRRPTLSFNIREQVQASIAKLQEPERSEVLEKIKADEYSLKKVQSTGTGDLWTGLFKPFGLEGLGNTILDKEDGVRRCASCGWEVRGGACVNCSSLFSGAEDSDGSQEDTDSDSEPNEYDSHDSFIDDDDDDDDVYEDGNEVNADENDLALSENSSDDSTIGTRRRRKDTRGVRSKTGRSRRSSGSRRVADVSEDEESEQNRSSVESGTAEESRSSLDEDSNGEDIQSQQCSGDEESDEAEETRQKLSRKGRRQQSRRAILISDEDEDEDKNRNSDEGKDQGEKDNDDEPVKGKTKLEQQAVATTSLKATGTRKNRQAKRVLSDSEKDDLDEVKDGDKTLGKVKDEGKDEGKGVRKREKAESSEDSSEDSNEDSSEDDFAMGAKRRSKRPRSGNLEALFA